MNLSFYNMKKVPKKYEKHKLLVLFGLKTQEELDEDLARYDVRDIQKLKSDILVDMKNNAIPSTYIVSIIPQNEFFKLPNKIIKSPEDLENLDESIEGNSNVVELWRFKKENEGVIGRFLITQSDLQIVEQVLSTNHRDIEFYNDEKEIPMIRASREHWKTAYDFDKINGISEEDKEKKKAEFISAIIEIERNREKIELLREMCLKIGVAELALEYKVDSKGFKFIDWDTSNDKKVLANIFRDKDIDKRRKSEGFEYF